MMLKPLVAAAGVAGLALTLLPRPALADDCTPSRLMFVLDKSSSMTHLMGERSQWEIAVEALSGVTKAYQDNIHLGLAIFPEPSQCGPGRVFVEPAFGTSAAITAALASPPPAGGNYTPMAETLHAMVDEPSLNDPAFKNHVVLITDGWQWCSPYDPATRFAPVEAVSALNAKGIITYVVGFGDAVDAQTLNMMAVMAGTERAGCDPTGTTPDSPNHCYYQADSPGELIAALMEVTSKVPEEEVCDGIDNNCSGQIDENLVEACESPCGSGTSVGVSVCQNGEWSACDAPCDEQPADCDEGFVLEDGVCVPVDLGGQPAGGCGCQLGASSGRGALAGTALPLLFALLWVRRRRAAA